MQDVNMVATGRNDFFQRFAPSIRPQTALREAITAAYRKDEVESVTALIRDARMSPKAKEGIRQTARKLIEALRAKQTGSGVEGLVQEYSLSSQEGVALMCLAEALLRIPDNGTRNALIRDKISEGDWKSHLGNGKSLFVNAATWGLVVTGKLTSTVNDRTLSAALTRLIARAGEPVIRRGVDMAMRMMGEQFVTGESIDEAIQRSRAMEEKGFSYSYDMLGEAATTAEDAERYLNDYETAIHAIGKASAGRGIYEGPGISIKLSALHPRYTRAQSARVMNELLPKVKKLVLIAKQYNIGLNIDAEEADRLELSLDLLEELCLDSNFAGWNGLGFVVQAYSKRCPYVLDYVIDLAKRSNRRIMVRLVKGAYWDAEIKRAQVDGLPGFPVFTRKIYTDISYIACAKKLLAATDFVFPQFATHNAQTLATIYNLSREEFHIGKYEFQCLHGMGEPLYEEVVGKNRLNRPCRIYAPVGTHETLLAYLVRRLLENGANSSFVNRIADPKISVDNLIEDPVDAAESLVTVGAPHEEISLPEDIFGASRVNSAGLDLSNEATLIELADNLKASAARDWRAVPSVNEQASSTGRRVLNPADHRDVVGTVIEASEFDARHSMVLANRAQPAWAGTSSSERAECLEKAADIMQGSIQPLIGILIREAGKSAQNAIAEVREAVDFLRYYAAQARETLGAQHKPLGTIVCISPWNFPLAIFTGQVAAALVAGNSVVAKPAEETPLVAFEAIKILHQAGIPSDVLQFAPGDGSVGAALVSAPQTAGVMFTGSTEVARLIQGSLSKRLSASGKPIPLIAETGGQNAMIVDSSALAEQVVGDVIASAFDSAGQRCSALRVLCLQEDVADRTLLMLKGALRELQIGRTDNLCVDIGPVITAEAKSIIDDHIAAMKLKGLKVEQVNLPGSTANGTFVAPTIIELESIGQLSKEVFGPVLHVIRFKREQLGDLIDQINGTGFGLTFGLHTRLDETIAYVTSRVKAGNLYVNRNVIGAVVGVQPFGGRGLSGTGPKAGGPLYLGRLVESAPVPSFVFDKPRDPALEAFVQWLHHRSESAAADQALEYSNSSALGLITELRGPVGERNLYALHPRGRVVVLPQTVAGLYDQLGAALAAGNEVVIDSSKVSKESLASLPEAVTARIRWSSDWTSEGPFAGALIEGDEHQTSQAVRAIAELPGPLVLVQCSPRAAQGQYCTNWLLEEVSTSINTAAAGGNASLMSIG